MSNNFVARSLVVVLALCSMGSLVQRPHIFAAIVCPLWECLQWDGQGVVQAHPNSPVVASPTVDLSAQLPNIFYDMYLLHV